LVSFLGAKLFIAFENTVQVADMHSQSVSKNGAAPTDQCFRPGAM